MDKIYLLYVLLLVLGAAAAIAVLWLSTIARSAAAFTFPLIVLTRPLTIAGAFWLSHQLYQASSGLPLALSLPELYYLATSPLKSPHYVFYCVLRQWLRQAGGVLAMAATLIVGLLAGGGSPVPPGRAGAGVLAILLLHFTFVSLALLYGLGRYTTSRPPRWPGFLAWAPGLLVLAGEILRPELSWQWVLPPLAAVVQVILNLKSAPGVYLVVWLAVTLLLFFLVAIALWLQARRFPLAFLIGGSWELAVLNEARAAGNTQYLRAMQAANRRRPASDASPFLHSKGVRTLLELFFLMRWRSGLWSLIKGYLFNLSLFLGTITTLTVTPGNLPLLFLIIFLTFNKLTWRQLQDDLYHEEFLYTLPLTGRQIVAAEMAAIALPPIIASMLAGGLYLATAPSNAIRSALLIPVILAGPGLLLVLIMAQAYEQFLIITGNSLRFIPQGAVALLLTGMVWGNAPVLISLLQHWGFGPFVGGGVLLGACLVISWLLLTSAGRLFKLR
ncbi:hypothetical protein [Neomoorella thermoacetica]|nr:hypothetical protein [Moorella thermoacetica]